MLFPLRSALAASFLGSFAGAALSAGPQESTHAFRNPELPVEQRVEDLLSQMTIDEKISQTLMDSAAIPRLGIHRYHWWNEALHGVARNGIATVFPQAIGLAATWNPQLHEDIAEIISTEARAKNNEVLANSEGTAKYEGLTIWSPNINIFRDPRWGRGQETYGEDPFLTGRLTVAFVRGLQGNDPHYLKSVATVKHYAVHSGPEPPRHSFDAVVSERDLWETYLPAFEAGIVEAGSQSLMSAYNAVNGIPAPAHELLLQKILRERWGFQGAVVGDVDNVSDMWRKGGHGYSKDAAEASAKALKAGNDLCSGATYKALSKALKEGLVTEADIDRSLSRLLTLRFKLGEFDSADRVPFRKIPPSVNASEAHDQMALRAARESLVLLKNDGTLPWKSANLRKVAILGPTADSKAALLGNYYGIPKKSITLAEGLQSRLNALGIEVRHEPGVPLVKGFRVSGEPIPDGVLFTDASRTQSGLKAEVFENDQPGAKIPDWERAASSTRTDTRIDLQWDEAQPVEGIPIRNAMVRWTGVIVPPTTGEYFLGVATEGGVRLEVDGKTVFDGLKGAGERRLGNLVSLEGGKAYPIVLEYVQKRGKGRIQLGWLPPGGDDLFDRAMAAAKDADHIILALGLTPELEGESMTVTAEGFEGGDRRSLDLPETQRKLLEAVAALGKPTAVVLTTGSPISFDDSKAGAVLLAWYYGQRGADAVTDAILGDYNPAGRLPITFYRNLDGLPDFTDYSMANRTYRYYTGTPLYAFGHGLSYSKFEYSNLKLSKTSAKPGETIALSVDVKNSGDRDGDEVVQVYASALQAPVPMPLRQLVAFQRVNIPSGETQSVSLEIPVNQLRRWDTGSQKYVVDPGSWKIAVGPSSDQSRMETPLTIQAAP